MTFQLQGFRELADALNASSAQLERAFNDIGYAFAQEANAIVEETLIQAAAHAGPDAFPPQYIAPMLSAASKIVTVIPGSVELNFEEMGTATDLAEGYHYGAKIAGGGQVELPYTGEELKNETEVRYQAWLRVFHGDTWHGINYAGVWNETITARLTVWADKAPQWLLLEYGQEEWEPTIDPYPIVEDITTELYGLFETMLQSEIEYLVENLNRPLPIIPAGAVYDIRGRGSRIRSLRTGQFITGG